MKTLIVYYSLEGNTAWMAERIAAKLSADLLRLVPKKAYPDKGFRKFFWGGKSAMMKESPELEPYTAELSGYDRIVFASPVWAGTFAPPLRTFIRKESPREKQFAFALCSGGGSPDKAFAGLSKLLGMTEDVPTLHLIDPKTSPKEENDLKITEFCRKLRV